VKRDANKVAHELSKFATTNSDSHVWLEEPKFAIMNSNSHVWLEEPPNFKCCYFRADGSIFVRLRPFQFSF
jgi:hypothetical protein